ncbi:MAG: hypothetical protein FJ316_08485 [SAR202 cluster bacterium]|nr:hypothetical protein [SAR202 cluster bacterium]
MPAPGYNDNVFINCPFDDHFRRIFDAIVFTIYDCGFVARCSLEEDATGEARLTKIMDIVSECKYGLHDISRTDSDPQTNLPRFNMPFELGLFVGARKFGNKDQKSKKFLILDTERYRFQQFISDLSGFDIKEHRNDPMIASAAVRNWLVTSSRRKLIPGSANIWNHYQEFLRRLPEYCRVHRLDPATLVFIEYSYAVTDILEEIESG